MYGVFAYGVDQAYLRAETLLDIYEPRVVILAFISNDISRTELPYYQRRWKPYFEYGRSGLELRNVPVPEGRPANRPFPTLNRAVGYSYLRMFNGKGHYGAAMNGWVAARLAALLRGTNAASGRKAD